MSAESAGRSRIRLLIIDDEVDVLDVLGTTAPAQGFVPATASTVDQAVQLIADGLEVDIVACDMTMPDGGAPTWMARAAEVCPSLLSRTILITGWSANGESPLPGVPIEHCLFKPFTMSEVRRVADAILARGQ